MVNEYNTETEVMINKYTIVKVLYTSNLDTF